MKKVLVIIGLCVLAGYLIFAAFYFEEKPNEQICSHFEVTIDNKSETNLVDIEEVEKLIDSKGLNPYGKPLKEINTYKIAEAISSNQMIKDADVFVTSNGGIRAVIESRKPILRVITTSGKSFYIDKDKELVPLSKTYVADLPLATGNITEEYAKTELYDFAMFLSENDFWNDQIEQIIVAPNQEVGLITNVGDHKIILGELTDFQKKLDKLKTFYKKGLSETGWNRYSIINLKYDKQVVCTKR